MPTIRRRKHLRRLTADKASELLTGKIRYSLEYAGYGDGVNVHVAAFIDDEMRGDWARNRGWLLEFWRSGKTFREWDRPELGRPWLVICGTKGTLPWAETHLASPHRTVSHHQRKAANR